MEVDEGMGIGTERKGSNYKPPVPCRTLEMLRSVICHGTGTVIWEKAGATRIDKVDSVENSEKCIFVVCLFFRIFVNCNF